MSKETNSLKHIADRELNEYARWYKIAAEQIDNEKIVGKRSKEEIVEDNLLSDKEDEWMMLAPADKDSSYMKSHTKNPNVWFRVEEDSIVMGLAFNQVSKVDKFKQIMHDFNEDARDDIREALKGLDDGWKMNIEQRWKWNFAGQQNLREDMEKKFEISEIEQNIVDVISLIDEWREIGKKRSEEQDDVAEEKPVINMPRTTIEKDEEIFRRSIDQIFNVYNACIDVKTGREIEKERKDLQEELENLKEKKSKLKDGIEKINNRISAKPPEDFLKGLKKRKKEQEERLEQVLNREDELENKINQ